jgi:iron complex transport system ATP-binding protein
MSFSVDLRETKLTDCFDENSQTQLSVKSLNWQVNQRSILSNINFAIETGEFVGLLGPNGSGKSSLLRCLYKYLKPSSGEILFCGMDIQSIPQMLYAQQVAVVLQHTPQQFHLSVKDVVGLGLVPHLALFSRRNKKDDRLIEQANEQVGLAHKENMDFELLSGGEKQRVMIARAIVQKPRLLIMDEPTSHLDVKYQIQVMELAKSLGITVLASFHDLNLASSVCDRLLLLKEGELVAQGSPHEVITEENLSLVFDVCTQVNTHPQKNVPLVTYFYGYVNNGGDHDK